MIFVDEHKLNDFVMRELDGDIWESFEAAVWTNGNQECAEHEHVLDEEGESDFDVEIDTYHIRKDASGHYKVNGAATVTASKAIGYYELHDWFEQAYSEHVTGEVEVEGEVLFSIEFDREGTVIDSSSVLSKVSGV